MNGAPLHVIPDEDYVYDFYLVKDEELLTGNEGDLPASEDDSEDSNCEANPRNDYPDTEDDESSSDEDGGISKGFRRMRIREPRPTRPLSDDEDYLNGDREVEYENEVVSSNSDSELSDF